jgi:lipid II:glycine glycyltransferase (peptidoglycan interpeptide bridge formation enzyme)
LTYEDGRQEYHLQAFYRLLLLTRRKHKLPAQPLEWFRNLIDCLGESLTIRLALKDGQPLASILTLRYKDVLVYKYGCSDASYNRLGGTQFLFWHTIQEAKQDGLREFDLGRSDFDNLGLAVFKDRWNATRSTLTYWRYPAPHLGSRKLARTKQVAEQVLAQMPDRLLNAAGRLLYRHMG